MNSDILLINPPGIYYETSDEHLGLGYISSYARSHGINVSILDIPLNGWTSQTAVKEIKKAHIQIDWNKHSFSGLRLTSA